MFICLKYSHDGKDIKVLSFNDTTGLVSISADNRFWVQKTTEKKYQIGEMADNAKSKIPGQVIMVFDSDNICHYRSSYSHMEWFLKEKIKK